MLPPKLFAECWLLVTQLGGKGESNGANFREQLSWNHVMCCYKTWLLCWAGSILGYRLVTTFIFSKFAECTLMG